MNRSLLFFCCFLLAYVSHAQTTIPVFDTVLFYDGYAGVVDEPVQPGVIRHRNDLYATKLSDEQLDMIGDDLTMDVTIKASCDNYDRIGNVNLAFVPKGDTTYNPDSVMRIEIGRFITPFMDKNKTPNTVPYHYDIDNISSLLRETSLRASYDIWAELEVFGVPYAANTEIAGCAGRNDVFYGSLSFTSNDPVASESRNVLTPLFFKAAFNNYQEGATDTIGKTTRSVSFEVEENLSDAILVLITSNHGANAGGEEYNRRIHNVYFDGTEVLEYKPGRTSCEPFRVYNTQGNGIYSDSARSDAEWQSFSNWCPGDVIDTRIIHLGALAAGTHDFLIRVPRARFVGGQGYIPLSLYMQGVTSGEVTPLENVTTDNHHVKLYPNPATSSINIETDEVIKGFSVWDITGKAVIQNTMHLDISSLQAGMYIMKIRLADESIVVRRFIKK